tara:strand:- start:994 stop:1341 length:348 start_codon:yes stop_codon:yes gene_type:complete
LGKKFKDVREDAPTNSAGAGAIAGFPPGDPPVFRRKAKRDKFAGCEVFEVDSDTYNKCSGRAKTRYERYSRFVGIEDLGQEIREYGRSNPSKPIIIKNESTGVMTYLKHGRNSNK